MDAFDRYQQGFSQSLKQAMREHEANHERIAKAHSANMRKMDESMYEVQDAFEVSIESIQKQMDENWKELEREALKRIQAPSTLFKEYQELTERRRYHESFDIGTETKPSFCIYIGNGIGDRKLDVKESRNSRPGY